ASGASILSRTAVSQVTERLWQEYEAFASRDLSEFAIAYFFVDGVAERLHAGLPRFRLYDLRHTFATHLLAQGAPITYVAAQLGHAKPTTTLTYYAHWIPSGDKRYIERLERLRTAIPAASGSKTVAANGGSDVEMRECPSC